MSLANMNDLGIGFKTKFANGRVLSPARPKLLAIYGDSFAQRTQEIGRASCRERVLASV